MYTQTMKNSKKIMAQMPLFDSYNSLMLTLVAILVAIPI